MKKLRDNKVFKAIKLAIKIILIVFVVAFVLMVALQRFSDNKFSLFNFRMFTVVSGSMEPKYNIGDVLIAKETEPSKIKVGDAISYFGKSGSVKGKVITHRVIEIEKDSEGKYMFYTKGLKEEAIVDPVVYEEQIYGVVVYKSVILSFVYKVVGTKLGMFIFVIIPLLYIIGSEFVEMLLEKEDKRRSKLNSKE